MTRRLRFIRANLLDLAAVTWAAYVGLTFAWPAASFALVPLCYVVHSRRLRWQRDDALRVVACHADTIRMQDVELSKRPPRKLRIVKKVTP